TIVEHFSPGSETSFQKIRGTTLPCSVEQGGRAAAIVYRGRLYREIMAWKVLDARDEIVTKSQLTGLVGDLRGDREVGFILHRCKVQDVLGPGRSTARRRCRETKSPDIVATGQFRRDRSEVVGHHRSPTTSGCFSYIFKCVTTVRPPYALGKAPRRERNINVRKDSGEVSAMRRVSPDRSRAPRSPSALVSAPA